MQIRINLVLMVTLTACLLSGCEPAATPVSESSVDSSDSLCQSDEQNLLQNPGFENLQATGLPAQWHAQQHGGNLVYTLAIDSGTATISKDGEQHWYLLSQNISATELQGKKVRFSTELMLDMHADGWQQSLTPGGGLYLYIKGDDPASHRRNIIQFETQLPNEPRLGQHDWHCAYVNVPVPEGAKWIHAGLLHQAYGTVSMRNPSLQVFD